MISKALTVAARLAITGYLSTSLFKRTVVRHTFRVLSEADEVSARLIASTVCHSTIALLLACDDAAQEFLSNDSQSIAPASPPSSSYTETTTSLSTPRNTRSISCINLDSPMKPTCRRISINSDTTLVADEDDVVQHIFSDNSLHAKDPESQGDESTFTKNRCSTAYLKKPLTSPDMHVTHDNTVDAVIQRMKSLTLDNDPVDTLTKQMKILTLDAGLNTRSTSCINLNSPVLSCRRLSISSHTTFVAHQDDLLVKSISSDAPCTNILPTINSDRLLASINSNISLVANGDDIVQHFFSDNSLHAKDLESRGDESTFTKKHCSTAHLKKQLASPDMHVTHDNTVDAVIQRMKALTLDNDPVDTLTKEMKILTLDTGLNARFTSCNSSGLSRECLSISSDNTFVAHQDDFLVSISSDTACTNDLPTLDNDRLLASINSNTAVVANGNDVVQPIFYDDPSHAKDPKSRLEKTLTKNRCSTAYIIQLIISDKPSDAKDAESQCDETAFAENPCTAAYLKPHMHVTHDDPDDNLIQGMKILNLTDDDAVDTITKRMKILTLDDDLDETLTKRMQMLNLNDNNVLMEPSRSE